MRPVKNFGGNIFLWLKSTLIYHYSHTQLQRTADQLEREKWLVPKLIPFNRYMLVPCAILVQVNLRDSLVTFPRQFCSPLIYIILLVAGLLWIVVCLVWI